MGPWERILRALEEAHENKKMEPVKQEPKATPEESGAEKPSRKPRGPKKAQ